MKILLLGGTGVLSSDILCKCVRENHEVYVLNRGHHNDELPKGVTVLIGNIRDVESTRNLIAGMIFDVVIDFLSFMPEHLRSSLSIFSDKCTQYIFISSCCAFRRAKEDFPIVEDSPKPNLKLPYGIAKYNCERYLKSLKDLNCNYTIVRPYVTYGDTRIPFGITPKIRKHWTLIGRIKAGKPMFVWHENGRIPSCTLMHTRDFANIFYQLLLNEKCFGEDINLVGNKSCTWKEYVEFLGQALSCDVAVVAIPTDTVKTYLPTHSEFLSGDRNLDAVFDNSKLKAIVSDYNPTIDLLTGAKETIESYRKHHFYDGIDYAYDGAVDRMLAKNGCRNLSFVDYLGDGNLIDKVKYYVFRYIPPKTINCVSKIKNGIKKLIFR